MTRRITTTFTIAAMAALAVACDNPVRPEHHPDAGGVIIRDTNTQSVIAQTIGARQSFTPGLSLAVGVPLEVEILFLDDDNPNDLDLAFKPGAGMSMKVVIVNENVVTYEDLGAVGVFEPHGLGITTAEIQLWHGDHIEFRTGNLSISAD